MTAYRFPYAAPTAPKVQPEGDSIRQARAVSPMSFRSQATGCGQTTSAARMGGAMRAAQVAGSMPAAQRAAVPESEGYPRGEGALWG